MLHASSSSLCCSFVSTQYKQQLVLWRSLSGPIRHSALRVHVPHWSLSLKFSKPIWDYRIKFNSSLIAASIFTTTNLHLLYSLQSILIILEVPMNPAVHLSPTTPFKLLQFEKLSCDFCTYQIFISSFASQNDPLMFAKRLETIKMISVLWKIETHSATYCNPSSRLSCTQKFCASQKQKQNCVICTISHLNIVI